MDIKSTYNYLYKFFTVGIWSIKRDSVSPLRYFIYSILKKLILAVEFTTTKRITSAAAALTYSTLLAIVPILAVVFAIARGFGYNKYIEEWFRNSFSSQPQAAETIIGFVNSYLVHTKRPVTSQMCEKLEAGVEIGDETPTAPAKTKLLSDTDCGLLLTITEGRFHQVKRMLQAVGNEVVYLKRLSMGALVLDETLPKGSWRVLTEEEKAQLGV